MLSTRYLIGCEESRVISAYEHRAGEQITATAAATATASTTSTTTTVVVITVLISTAAATSPTDEGGEVSYVHQLRRLLGEDSGDYREI